MCVSSPNPVRSRIMQYRCQLHVEYYSFRPFTLVIHLTSTLMYQRATESRVVPVGLCVGPCGPTSCFVIVYIVVPVPSYTACFPLASSWSNLVSDAKVWPRVLVNVTSSMASTHCAIAQHALHKPIFKTLT